ncbi:hypothetical protein SBI67_04910 [Mycolicibacterium sp. 120266]|uniref:hypothetical protein n=1 Tax=Mycolicibacterium sp. 120266 TaxID=3090601 RepID=UPI00299E3F1B|nr:hypothetical protein [Mycolicibacterium sp. 120266]MDX1871446.1 hypothetical protein [Mycolicibacterium sp. 120266]
MSDESPPIVTLAAGVAAAAVGGVGAVYRGAERVPVLGRVLHQTRAGLTARGQRVIEPVTTVIVAVAVQLVERVLDELDLDELVRRRVDLVALANEVVEGIDLQAIIRQSTESVTAEVMTDVRSQGERADDLVAGFVDRLLGRGRA